MTTVTTTATYKTKITADLPDWPSSDVTFQLVADFFTGDGEEILAGKEYKIALSATGNDDGAFYLPTPDNTGDTAVNWRLTLPSGYEEIITVAYNASAQSVSDLIAAGATTTDPDTITAALAAKVNKTGDTMTGALTLSGAPTADLHAATKKYVDDNAGGGAAADVTFTPAGGVAATDVQAAIVEVDAKKTAGDTIGGNDRLTLLDRIAALEASVFLDPPAGSTLINDAFTDTNSTALTAHTPAPTNTPGNSWAHIVGTFDIQSNKANCASVSGYAIATIDSGVADCTVQATITYIGTNTGIVARCSDGTHFILATVGATCYIIERNGGLTVLTSSAFSPTIGVDYTITLTVNGTAISVDINDGALTLSATSSVNTSVTKHGLYCEATGRTWNDFAVASLPGFGTALTAGAYSWYNTLQNTARSGYIESSFLASWIVYTDATDLLVGVVNNALSTDWARIAYRVDEGAWAVLSPAAADSTEEFEISLGSGNKHKVEFVAGVQSKPGAVIFGAWPSYVQPAGSTYCVDGTPTSKFASSMVIYGDSIAVGDGADVEVTEGFATLLRDALPEHPVVCEAWGYRSLYDDANTAGLIDALVAKIAAISPAIVWLAIGTNDYGLEEWSAANFGTGYQALLTDLIAALPSARIYCMCPLHRTDESANALGDTLGAYRTAMQTAVTNIGNANVTYVDASAWLGDGDLADGVHPSTAGHAIVAAQILAAMD